LSFDSNPEYKIMTTNPEFSKDSIDRIWLGLELGLGLGLGLVSNLKQAQGIYYLERERERDLG
jgi:hypothetical protein